MSEANKLTSAKDFTLDDIKILIQQCLEEHTNERPDELKLLKQVITRLKESNGEMVRLLSDGKTGTNDTVGQNENGVKDNKNLLNLKFQENGDDTKKEKEKDTPEHSSLSLYRFVPEVDQFLLRLGLLGAIGTGIIQPLSAIFFGGLVRTIIDYASGITDKFLYRIQTFAEMNLLIGLAVFALTYISTETFNYSAKRQIFNIRSLYLRRLLNQDVAWYDLNQTGDFASRMSNDLSKLGNGIGEKRPLFMNFQVIFFTSLVVSLMNGWELAAICLPFVTVSMLILWVIRLLTSKFATEELDAYGSACSIALETLSSIRTVVAFGGQRKEIQRYNENLGFTKNNRKQSLFVPILISLFWFTAYANYALAFWYGVKLILRDKAFAVENMVTILFSIMTGMTNFGVALTNIESFGVLQVARNKLFKVIDYNPVINLSKGQGETIPNLKGNIKLKNVHFRYPSREEVPTLNGLDLEINPGETVVLVGASGCGKSTVIQLIQRFYDPTEGEIYLDGSDLKQLNLTWLRRQIGVVDQDSVLFGTTISENIKYGNQNATEDDIINAAKKANAHRFIKLLPDGYNTWVGERGTQLSRGQKQRIAIARALVRNPSILLLDEATSALDNPNEAKVLDALELARRDRTTIIVAHRLSTIQGANRIVVISEGRVIEQGTHDELMALNKAYYSLVTTQVHSTELIEQLNKNENSDTYFDNDNVDPQSKTTQDMVLSKKEEDMNQEKGGSLKDVMKMNASEWPQILVACIGAIITGCAMPVLAIPFGDILGMLASGTEEKVRSESNKFVIYFIIAGVVVALANFFQIYMFGIADAKLTKRARSGMFQAMLKQEIGYFDKKSNGAGALCAKLSEDFANIKGAIGPCIGTILQSITSLSLSIGLSIYYEWRLGLLALAVTFFSLVATFFEGCNTGGLNNSGAESLQQSTGIVVEGLGSIRTIASLGCEETFYTNYISKFIPHNKKNGRSTHWRSLVLSLSRSSIFFVFSACIYYGGHLIKDGLPYKDVFTVLLLLIMGTGSIFNALVFAPNFAKGIQAARKVQVLLSRTPKIMDTDSSIEKDTVKGNLKYSHIYFSYPTRSEVPVLKGLDLTFLQGKIVALVGPSGCGKSTVFQLAERFYDPTAGKIFLDEDPIKTLKLESLRSHLALVSQEPDLFNKTIAENIAYGDNSREVEMSDIIEAAKNANIHNFVSSLPMGYETKLGEKGAQLSRGQKQRIAIARALIRNPKVLLLDEATSSLDSESEKVVQEALNNGKEGRTCVIISHRLTTVQDADVIFVIKDGVIAEMGTHEELLAMNESSKKIRRIQREKEEDTQETSFFSLMDSIADNIKCPVCVEILQKPIMLCKRGHNTCGKCYQSLRFRKCPTCRGPLSDIRNIEMEQMIERLQKCSIKVSCNFSQKGCKFTLALNEKEQHESECRFRKFQCEGRKFAKWKCDWIGEYSDLHKHFKDYHNNHTWMEYRTEANMKICLENDFYDIQIISFFNGQHYFYYKHKVDVNKAKAYWTFQLVGTKDQAKNFYYEFEVHQGPIRKFKVSEICENDTTNVFDTFEKEKCVVMSFNSIKNFLNNDGELPFKFRIMSAKKVIK